MSPIISAVVCGPLAMSVPKALRAAAATVHVRLVAMAVKIARPSAPPTCCEAFSSEAARPALSAGTPALAAVVTPTNTGPIPTERTSIPGRRSARKDPWTGIRESQYMPPAAIRAPTTITGRVPTLESSCEETPAAIPMAKHSGTYAAPVWIAE